MFSVPGWAVSASHLVQEKPRTKESSGTKKRKREDSGYPGEDRNTVSKGVKDKRKVNTDTTTPSRPYHTKVRGQIQHLAKTDHGESRTQGRRAFEADTQGLRHRTVKRNPAEAVNETTESVESKREGIGRNGQKGPRHRKPGHKARTQTEPAAILPDSTMSEIPERTAAGVVATPPTAKLTPLQAKMRSKLTSARFRHLNETLYTTSSTDALQLFTASPDLFVDYHTGFSQQVKDSWPQNPVEGYIKTIKVRGNLDDLRQGNIPLPRRKTGSCTIADLGCGDAPLARGCQGVARTLKLKFHNYDLHAANSLVTVADISNLPLRDGEADVAVFCLSLMGTNWVDFVEEAWRILRGDGKGEVWVSEVKSRFGRTTKGRVVENSVGKRRKKPKQRMGHSNGEDRVEAEYDGPEQFVEDAKTQDQPEDETDISAFVNVFTRRGFQLRESSVDKRNKMFVSMIFTKTGIPTAGKHKGLKWTGKEYQRQPDGKSRFAGSQSRRDDEEVSPEDEAKVLKPCVYKSR